MSARHIAARLMVIAGVISMAGGAAVGTIRRGLFESDTFAQRLAHALNDPRVSAFVAERITDVVVREKPDLVAVRPLLRGTAQSVVSTDAFQSVVRLTAREAHAAMFSRGGRNLLLSVPDLGLILRGALANASPTLAARVPTRLSTVIAHFGEGRASRLIVDLWRVGRSLAWAAWIGVLVGLGLVIGGVALAPRRSQALRWTSVDLALAGLGLLVLLPLGRLLAAAIPDTSLAQEAAAGLFEVFTRGLRRIALGIGSVGLICSAAAYSVAGSGWISGAARTARAWLWHPASVRQRVGRGAIFIVTGCCLVLRPSTTLATLAVVGGTVLTFVGLQQLFGLALRGRAPDKEDDQEMAARVGRRRAVVLIAAAGVAAVAVALLSRTREAAMVRAPAAGCNGDERLCGRPLDQVVFAGTHNAMGSVDAPGWMFPQQERGLAGQLEDGVRALLIDIYAGVPVAGNVKTELRADLMKEAERAVGAEGVEAAMRLRERLVGPPEGPPGLYLCHGFCEIGAQPLVPWLRVLHAFMDANPREVVIVVIEDYVPPADIAAAFAEVGLEALAYRGAPHPPWPTLAELGKSGQRLVVFLESGTEGVAWLHPAFETIQETPYSFRRPSAFSCAVNRGGRDGSIFQVNHWIETPPMPKPSNAAIVNAHAALLGRLRRCAEERGHLPNIVAVDFYRTGDLFDVVREMNGLSSAATASETPAVKALP
jgi:hypothetical protein